MNLSEAVRVREAQRETARFEANESREDRKGRWSGFEGKYYSIEVANACKGPTCRSNHSASKAGCCVLLRGVELLVPRARLAIMQLAI